MKRKSCFVFAFMVAVSSLFWSCQREEMAMEENLSLKAAVTTSENATLYWGHVKFTRSTEKPATESVTIPGVDLSYFEGCLRLKIKNGDGKKNFVDNAVVNIDGEKVVFPGDFEVTPL